MVVFYIDREIEEREIARMILKMKNNESWMFVDKIKEIDCMISLGNCNDASVGVTHMVGNSENPASKSILYFTKEDGSEHRYIVCQEVYLLADNGKTIEKIN
jgi:hypothetical protein